MRLPPYGKSITQSLDVPIMLWAGRREALFKRLPVLKKKPTDTIVHFAYLDAADFIWPVKDREVIIVYFLHQESEWIDELVLSLFFAGASNVSAILWKPHSKAHGEKTNIISYD